MDSTILIPLYYDMAVRFISKNIKKPLVDKLLFGNLKSGGQIKLDIVNGSLKFKEIKDKIKV